VASPLLLAVSSDGDDRLLSVGVGVDLSDEVGQGGESDDLLVGQDEPVALRLHDLAERTLPSREPVGDLLAHVVLGVGGRLIVLVAVAVHLVLVVLVGDRSQGESLKTSDRLRHGVALSDDLVHHLRRDALHLEGGIHDLASREEIAGGILVVAQGDDGGEHLVTAHHALAHAPVLSVTIADTFAGFHDGREAGEVLVGISESRLSDFACLVDGGENPRSFVGVHGLSFRDDALRERRLTGCQQCWEEGSHLMNRPLVGHLPTALVALRGEPLRPSSPMVSNHRGRMMRPET
jgi:hypothetical protein